MKCIAHADASAEILSGYPSRRHDGSGAMTRKSRSLRVTGVCCACCRVPLRVTSTAVAFPGASRALLGTSRADIDPHNFQPSRSNQLSGLRTTNGSYVSRIGHMKSLLSSSCQPGNKIPDEKGSTSQVLASPCWSSPCLRQLLTG